jgi:hypothetical protein
MMSPGYSVRCSSSTDTTSKGASLSTTAGRLGARWKRRTAFSICSLLSWIVPLRRRNDARSESGVGLSSETVYPGRFSAMTRPFRS